MPVDLKQQSTTVCSRCFLAASRHSVSSRQQGVCGRDPNAFLCVVVLGIEETYSVNKLWHFLRGFCLGV